MRQTYSICGIPLSEYTAVVYSPEKNRYVRRKPAAVVRNFERALRSVPGVSIPLKLTGGRTVLARKSYPHEILVGAGFRRPGIPAYRPGSIQYGITKNGTVYFLTASPVLAGYLLGELLKKIGTPGKKTGICKSFDASPFQAEIPLFTEESARALGYETVYEETFDGEQFDWDAWKPWTDGKSACGFDARSQVTLRDGCLILTGEWKENGEYGPGWYTGSVGLKQKFCRGYFESRMKCTPCLGREIDFWSAFWIFDYEYAKSRGGPGGSEMDIVENFGSDYHTSCIWVNGAEGEGAELSNELFECAGMGLDFEDWHTFGFLWDEEYYRVFVDGIPVLVSDYAFGTSEIAEIVWFSLCMPPKEIQRPHSDRVEMIVDGLKVLQKP
ncbi:MAG: glycoside hydrolase family 16 protein [Clostridia bacterium]|nr:glycoside hydrolase family 16 protein [Clostridia bacterium]